MRSLPNLLFFRLNSPSFPSLEYLVQFWCRRGAPTLFTNFVASHALSPSSMSFLDWRHQNWSQHSRQFFTRAKWSGRIASFDLLATLPWMQPRILLAGWAGTTHCQLMVSCSPAITHKSFSAWCSQSLLCPNCRCAGIAPTQVWDLALGPLAWAHLSSLSRSLWILSLPSR